MSYPRCFESEEQWQAWRLQAQASRHRPDWYCRDCSLEFKAEMLLQGRCGHPETIFRVIYDGQEGELVGLPGHIRGVGKLARSEMREGRPAKGEKRGKNVRVHVRIPEVAHQSWVEAAAAEGLELSEWLRRVLGVETVGQTD